MACLDRITQVPLLVSAAPWAADRISSTLDASLWTKAALATDPYSHGYLAHAIGQSQLPWACAVNRGAA